MIGYGTAVFATGMRPASAQESVFKLAVIQPQTGDCAQWGVPITRSAELWADEMNEKGGVSLKSGQKLMVEVRKYDNICYIPGEELKSARKAVLDDGVHFILQTFTPASRQAIAPLTQDSEALSIAYGSGYLSKQYPYLVGGITGAPTSVMLAMSHVLEKNPDLKRVAMITANNSFGVAAKAYAKAGLVRFADRVEIVHDQSYDSAATADMLGLLSPLAAANPEIIFQNGLVPAQQAQMIEIMGQLGYKGLFVGEQWVLPLIRQRSPGPEIAGRIYGAFAVEPDEPSYSPRAYEFYQRYLKKYGEAEGVSNAVHGYCTLCTLEVGVNAAASADAKTVLESLYATEQVDHPIFGPSRWGGEDIYGANHHLLTPLPMYVTDAEGQYKVDGVVDPAAWWEQNKAGALPILAEGGQVFKG